MTRHRRSVGIPAAGVVSRALWVALAAGLGWWARGPVPKASRGGLGAAGPAPNVEQAAALRLIRSEALAFLVVQKVTSQVVVTHSESRWAGAWSGVLWAVVDWRWGLDLREVAASDLRRDGPVLVVRLPEPKLLDFGVRPESIRTVLKSTAWPKARDILEGGSQRRLLQARLRQEALAFARQQQLLPTRAQIAARLTAALEAMAPATGLRIRFE